MYYLVRPKDGFNLKIASGTFEFEGQEASEKQSFRLVDIDDLTSDDVTFPIDKLVVTLLKEKNE